jgi:transcriptional regulator with XRE-family HTH domain
MGPITAAVHPAISQRRQRPSRPGLATSSAPIGQAQQTHTGALIGFTGRAARNMRKRGAAACGSGSTQACSAALLLSLAALFAALVSLLPSFLGSDGPEQFGLHDAHDHGSAPSRGNRSSRAESSMRVTSSTSDGRRRGLNRTLSAGTPPAPRQKEHVEFEHNTAWSRQCVTVTHQWLTSVTTTPCLDEPLLHRYHRGEDGQSVSEPPPEDQAPISRPAARQTGRARGRGPEALASPQQPLASDAPYRVALHWWRRRREMSLGALGALAFCTRQHLSAMELGERRGSLDTAERLDRALGAAGDLLQRYRRERLGCLGARADTDDVVDPDTARAASASTDRNDGQARALTESVELSRQAEASELGPVTLQHLDLAVQRYGSNYLQVPPQELFQQVTDQRRYVVELLQRRHTLAEGSGLYVVCGWLTGLLAHLALDMGNVQAARAHAVTPCSSRPRLGMAISPHGCGEREP